MRFSRSRPQVVRSLDEAFDVVRTPSDYRVRVRDIEWSEGVSTLSFRYVREGSRGNFVWGGDAYTHLVKDLKLRERDPDSEVLLRVVGHTVIGGLTPEYRSVRNFDILRVLQRLDFKLHLAKISPSYSFFFATPIQSSEYVPAVRIINSETGYKTLLVETGMMKLVCQNGLIVTEQDTTSALQSLHRAGSLPENFDLREEIQRRMDDTFDHCLRRLDSVSYCRNGVEAVNLWVNQEFGARQARQVLEDLRGRSRPSATFRRIDIINAVTRLHQTFPRSADRWQTLGGELLQPDYFDRYFNRGAEPPVEVRQSPEFVNISLAASPIRMLQQSEPSQHRAVVRSSRDLNEPLHGPALEEARRIEREFNEAYQREMEQAVETRLREQRTDPLLLDRARERVEQERQAAARQEVEARIRGYLS